MLPSALATTGQELGRPLVLGPVLAEKSRPCNLRGMRRMLESQEADTDQLLARFADGDESCLHELLIRHRGRLRQMVTVRMDARLSARVDPSDVVQEVLIEAARKLPDYAQEQPLPYYPWLRQIAWECLVQLHRRHVVARRRTVEREAVVGMELSDESVMHLAKRFVTSGTSPSGNLLRKELRQRVRDGLDSLADQDREILVLRYLEQLKVNEVSVVLGISEGAATMRQLRALERLRGLLQDSEGDAAT